MIRQGAWMMPALLLLAGCGGGKDAHKGGPGQGAGGTPEAGYVIAHRGSVPLTTELPGRTSAFASSEVRPQVSGVIQKRLFVEGSYVHQGQTLYQIDPSLYRASVGQASANLNSAQANAEAAKIKADRYAPLAKMQAVSQQDYTDAVATARQATASVAQNNAALQTAKINLHYTRVPAPISGRIGRSLYTQGALVTANQTDPLTTIQQLDPIYVDIQQSSADLLALRRKLAAGGTVPTSAVVHLKLEDGSDYGLTGSVEFSEVVVDPSTGTVTLRARFANPQGLLLPGMFVRASFAQAINTNAIIVPVAGINRDPRGNTTALVVGPGNKALLRTVTVSTSDGVNWVVTSGLNDGDKVITEGTGKIKPNQVVKPVPAGSPQRLNPGNGKGKGGKPGAGGASNGSSGG